MRVKCLAQEPRAQTTLSGDGRSRSICTRVSVSLCLFVMQNFQLFEDENRMGPFKYLVYVFFLFSDCRYVVFPSDHGHFSLGLWSSSASHPVS